MKVHRLDSIDDRQPVHGPAMGEHLDRLPEQRLIRRRSSVAVELGRYSRINVPRPLPALLREGDPGATATDWLDEVEEWALAARSPAICCAACHNPVTRDSERTTIAGSHVHSKVNPVAVEYTFGCFRHASGATVAGTPTTEHTWFAGYAWSFSLCGGCGCHLGWHFERPGAASFFGLILERLIETGSGD